MLLLPLPAGRVGLAARDAQPIADPIFSFGVPLPRAPVTDGALDAAAGPPAQPRRGRSP